MAGMIWLSPSNPAELGFNTAITAVRDSTLYKKFRQYFDDAKRSDDCRHLRRKPSIYTRVYLQNNSITDEDRILRGLPPVQSILLSK
ncbi:hypothetical protein [Brumicola nitratireducens]|nr:hypothetical protein [Glaciecola nitratireducens]